jgi:WhiB family redox-sensing transcriptional regulator
MLEKFEPFHIEYPDFITQGEPLCAQTDPDMFFPDEPIEGNILNRTVYTYEREAKIICSSCPYTEDCLDYALKNPELQGIWGGSTEKQRSKIRRGQFVNLGIPARRHV